MIGATTTPKWMVWVGWVLTIGAAGMFIMSGVMKFLKPPELIEGLQKFGWDVKLVPYLAIAELVSTLLYLIPKTAVLGAVLLTGYLGGAIATHVRVEDQFIIPIILGVVVWGALWLREDRVRTLLPWRGSLR